MTLHRDVKDLEERVTTLEQDVAELKELLPAPPAPSATVRPYPDALVTGATAESTLKSGTSPARHSRWQEGLTAKCGEEAVMTKSQLHEGHRC